MSIYDSLGKAYKKAVNKIQEIGIEKEEESNKERLERKAEYLKRIHTVRHGSTTLNERLKQIKQRRNR